MFVNGLDHINIRTAALAETVRFFADVLDLKAGDPPAGLDPARIQWMFDGSGRALFHLSTAGSVDAGDDGAASGHGTGAVHHVALDCRDYAAMIARLDRLGVPYRCLDVLAGGIRQVFVRDPNDVLLELNFRGRQD